MELEDVRRRCLNCGRCELSELGYGTVAGEGPADAEVMFVGESPDADDLMARHLFAGERGKLLDCYLNVIGLYRDKNIYFTTLLKCRPPGDRGPLPEERSACLEWLREEFKALRPKVVICAGPTVAQALIDRRIQFKTRLGQFIVKGSTNFIAVPRPKDLLERPGQKPNAFACYAAIRTKIGEVCKHTYPPDFLLSYDQKKAIAETETLRINTPKQLSLVH